MGFEKYTSCAMGPGARPKPHQLMGQRESVRVCAFIAERTGVGKHGHVETGGHVRSDAHVRGASQGKDQLGNRACIGVDPVQVSEVLPAGVMVDVDEAACGESREPAAFDAVAFQQDDQIEVAFHMLPMPNALRAWKPAVDQRHAIAEGHLHLFAKLFQQHATGQHRTYCIAIRTRMRGHQNALCVLNRFEDRMEHRYAH